MRSTIFLSTMLCVILATWSCSFSSSEKKPPEASGEVTINGQTYPVLYAEIEKTNNQRYARIFYQEGSEQRFISIYIVYNSFVTVDQNGNPEYVSTEPAGEVPVGSWSFSGSCPDDEKNTLRNLVIRHSLFIYGCYIKENNPPGELRIDISDEHDSVVNIDGTLTSCLEYQDLVCEFHYSGPYTYIQ